MRTRFPPRALLRDTKLVSVVVANVIPTVGLVAFGTSATALLTFYWLELGVLAVWALVKALFAGHRAEPTTVPPALRGTVGTLTARVSARLSDDESADASHSGDGLLDRRLTIPRTDVGIYLGTIPALFFVVPLLASVWIGFGGLVVGPVLAATDASTAPAWVLIGAGVVFVSEGGETVFEYFYRGEHRETSAWTAAKGIFWQGFALASVGLLVVLLAYESAAGRPVNTARAARGPLVFTAVAGKLLIDLTIYYLDGRDTPLREQP